MVIDMHTHILPHMDDGAKDTDMTRQMLQKSYAEGTEMVMPGDNTTMTVTLIAPIAMEEGLRFAIREGGHTVGAGVVAKIIE